MQSGRRQTAAFNLCALVGTRALYWALCIVACVVLCRAVCVQVQDMGGWLNPSHPLFRVVNWWSGGAYEAFLERMLLGVVMVRDIVEKSRWVCAGVCVWDARPESLACWV